MHALTILGVLAAFSLLFLSLLALCAERGFRPLVGVRRFYGRLSVLGRVLLLAFVGAFIVYASTKSDGDESSTNAPPARMSVQRRSLAVQPGVVISEAETNLGYRVLAVRDGDEIVPPGIEAVTNAAWRLRGGMMDAFRIGMGPEPTEEEWRLQTGPVWSFPWRAAWTHGLTVFANGEFQPSVRDDFFPRPFGTNLSLVPQAKWGEIADGSLESLFWHELTPSNSLVLTWQNALYGRDANAPTNFQAELFGDGSFDYRYPDRTVSYAPVFPFDWDGDGLENSVDPEPRVAGPDAHGTNAEWYNNVCSNVFVAVEGTDGLTLAPRHAGVNTNAYYFVDVVAERGPAPIYFTADGPSRLGNPVVVAQAGVTNRVPLLIGATYEVVSDVPFVVLAPPEVVASPVPGNGAAQNVNWPVPVSFSEDDDGTLTPCVPEPLRSRLGGGFSWSGGCCVTMIGDTLKSSCSSCGCGGCSAVAAYRFENYSLFQPAVTCGCGASGGDPTQTPFVATSGGAAVAAGFSRRFVMMSDGGANGVVRSTRTVLTLAAWGGTNGGTLTVEPANLDRLRPIHGELPASETRTLLPYEAYTLVVTNEGAVASEWLDDVRIRAVFEENNTGTRVVRNARMTVCGLSVAGIKFNHDIDGFDSDAINVRRDGATDGVFDITDGEWCGAGATNVPACYIGGATPRIWARFRARPRDLGHVRLGAQAQSADFPLGDVPVRGISFADGDSGWVVLPACDGTNAIPRRVDIAESQWFWQVEEVGRYSLAEPFVFSKTGPHKIYTILAPPQSPWKRYPNRTQCAWTFALDVACTWTRGATTTNEMLSAITSNIFYNCGLKYDIKGGSTAYSTKPATFDLFKFILKGNGDVVNCYDQAHAVYLLGNLLGADVYVKRLEPFGYLKGTSLVGRGYTNNPFHGAEGNVLPACCDPDAVGRSSFCQHFFCMNGEHVFDGCAGPVLGTVGLSEYIQMSVDSDRAPPGSRSGTVTDVSDYTDVRFFE